MSNLKKIAAWLLLIIIPVVSLAGCGSKAEKETTKVNNLKEEIVGVWRDSADISGYEFREDGSVDVTYVNITVPIFNIPINGTATGTYIIDGNTVTVKYSIYTKTIAQTYTAVVENNALIMKDVQSGEEATYLRTVPEKTTVAVTDAAKPWLGAWSDSTDMSGYTFLPENKLKLKYMNFTVPVLNMPVTGTFDGTYIVNGDTIIMQYSVYSQSITKTYKFSVNGDRLTLTDKEDGSVSVYVRSK